MCRALEGVRGGEGESTGPGWREGRGRSGCQGLEGSPGKLGPGQVGREKEPLKRGAWGPWGRRAGRELGKDTEALGGGRQAAGGSSE